VDRNFKRHFGRHPGSAPCGAPQSPGGSGAVLLVLRLDSWKIGGRNGICYDHGVGVMQQPVQNGGGRVLSWLKILGHSLKVRCEVTMIAPYS